MANLDIIPHHRKNWAVIEWQEYEGTGKHPYHVLHVEDTKNKAMKKMLALIQRKKAQGVELENG